MSYRPPGGDGKRMEMRPVGRSGPISKQLQSYNEGIGYKRPKLQAGTAPMNTSVDAPRPGLMQQRDLSKEETDIVEGNKTFFEKMKSDRTLEKRINGHLMLFRSQKLPEFERGLEPDFAVMQRPQSASVSVLRDSASVLSLLSVTHPGVFRRKQLASALLVCLEFSPEVVQAGPRRAVFGSMVAASILWRAFESSYDWPYEFVTFYANDALGQRIWVDREPMGPFVANILTFVDHLNGSRGGHEVKDRYPDAAQCLNITNAVLSLIRKHVTGEMRSQGSHDGLRNVMRLLTQLTQIPPARSMAGECLHFWIGLPSQQGSRFVKDANDLIARLAVDTRDSSPGDFSVLATMLWVRQIRPHRATGPGAGGPVPTAPDPLFTLLANNPDYVGVALEQIVKTELSLLMPVSAPGRTSLATNKLLFGDVWQRMGDGVHATVGRVFRDLAWGGEPPGKLRSTFLRILRACAQIDVTLNFSAFSQGLLSLPTTLCRAPADMWLLGFAELVAAALISSVPYECAGQDPLSTESTMVQRREVWCRFSQQLLVSALKWIQDQVSKWMQYHGHDNGPYNGLLLAVLKRMWLLWEKEELRGPDIDIDRYRFASIWAAGSDEVMALCTALSAQSAPALPFLPMECLHFTESILLRSAWGYVPAAPGQVEVARRLINNLYLLIGQLPSLPVSAIPPDLLAGKSVCVADIFWRSMILLVTTSALSPAVVGKVTWEDVPTAHWLIERVVMESKNEAPSMVESLLVAREQHIAEYLRGVKSGYTPPKLMLYEAGSEALPRPLPPRLNGYLGEMERKLNLRQRFCSVRDPDFFSMLVKQHMKAGSPPWVISAVEQNPQLVEWLPVRILCGLLPAVHQQKGRVWQSLHLRLCRLLSSTSSQDREAAFTILQYFLREIQQPTSETQAAALVTFGRLVEEALANTEQGSTDMEVDGDVSAWLWIDRIMELPCVRVSPALVQDMVRDALLAAIAVEQQPEVFRAYIHALAEGMDASDANDQLSTAAAVGQMWQDRSLFVRSIAAKVWMDTLRILQQAWSVTNRPSSSKGKSKRGRAITLSAPQAQALNSGTIAVAKQGVPHGMSDADRASGEGLLMTMVQKVVKKLQGKELLPLMHSGMPSLIDLVIPSLSDKDVLLHLVRYIHLPVKSCEAMAATLLSTHTSPAVLSLLGDVGVRPAEAQAHLTALLGIDSKKAAALGKAFPSLFKLRALVSASVPDASPCTALPVPSDSLSPPSQPTARQDPLPSSPPSQPTPTPPSLSPSVERLAVSLRDCFQLPALLSSPWPSLITGAHPLCTMYLQRIIAITRGPQRGPLCRFILSSFSPFASPSMILDLVATAMEPEGWEEVTRPPGRLDHPAEQPWRQALPVRVRPPDVRAMVQWAAKELVVSAPSVGPDIAQSLSSIAFSRVPLISNAALQSPANGQALVEVVSSMHYRGTAAEPLLWALYAALPDLLCHPIQACGDWNQVAMGMGNVPMDATLSRTLVALLDQPRAAAAYALLLRAARHHPMIVLRHIPACIALLRGAERLPLQEFIFEFAGAWPWIYQRVLALFNALQPSIFHTPSIIDGIETVLLRLLSLLNDEERALSDLAQGMGQFLVGFVLERGKEAATLLQTFSANIEELSQQYPQSIALHRLHTLLDQPAGDVAGPVSSGGAAVEFAVPALSNQSPERWEPLDDETPDEPMELDERSSPHELIPSLLSTEHNQRQRAGERLVAALSQTSDLIDPVMDAFLACVESPHFGVRQDALHWVPEIVCYGGPTANKILSAVIALGPAAVPTLQRCFRVWYVGAD